MNSPHDERTTGRAGPEERRSFPDPGAAAARLAEPLRREARMAAERQKEHGADQLAGVAEAVRRAARELEPQLPQTAAWVDSAAARLERLSASLHAQSVNELAGALVSAARNRPATVFAGAVVAGFVLSRVLGNVPPDQRS